MRMAAKSYLVTGAAGFIGAAIAQRLLKDGHEVWTIDNLSTGYKENIPQGCHFIQGDCQDSAVIAQLEKKRFDAILHIAGQSSGEISFDDPAYDLRTNTESTLRLIKYALAHGCERFIYASSMSVYGHAAEEPIAEDHPTKPLSFYGVGKLASEQYLRIYASKGLKTTALRYFNVYGPHQNMQNLRQGMVSIFLAQLIKQDKVFVKGALDRYRDIIYIDDIVDNTIKVIDHPAAVGQVFNFGTGVKTTVGQLLELMMELSGIKKEVVIAPGTPGDQKGIYADIGKARDAVGFEYQWSLEKGLGVMVEWAKSSTW